MTVNSISSGLDQLPLLGFDKGVNQAAAARQRKSVDRTMAQIRQLHEELNSRLYAHPTERPVIHTPADAATLLIYFIGSLDHEEMWVVDVDTRHRVMNLVALYKGNVNSAQVRVGEVFRQALLDNAPAILVAHNHPSGDPSPSPEDVTLTRSIYQAGKLLDIELLDHIIIGRDRHQSLKELGLGIG